MSGMPETPGMIWQRPPVYQESEQSICLYPNDAMQASQQPADEAAKSSSSAADHGRLYIAASEQSCCLYPDSHRPAYEAAKYAL